jgi:hypothetical protein
MPDTRVSITHKFQIQEHEGYVFRWLAATFVDSKKQAQAMSAENPEDTTTSEDEDE